MFKKGLLYILVNYAIQFINIFLSLVMMKYLTTAQLGDLSLARTWQQFVDYSHLGSRFSLDRFIPLSKNREKKLLVTSVLLTNIIGALTVLIVALVFNHSNLTVVILTLCGVFISISNIIKAYYRATNRINEMLWLVIYSQFLPVLLPLIIYLFTHSFEFYLYSSLGCYGLAIIRLYWIERSLKKYFILKLLSNRLIFLFKPSLLLFLNAIFTFLYLVMDRFFIDGTGGRDQLGNFSVIIFAFSALMIIPSTCAELLFVKVIKQCSQTGRCLFIKECIIMFAVTMLGVIVANVVMKFFIENFTKYGYLVPELHLATFAVIPFAFTAIYYHVMNGLDLRKQMVAVSAAVCLVLIVYYCIPVFTHVKFELRDYLYAKLATGWLVLLGYVFFILRVKNGTHHKK
ncbi:TPA: polysaccharide biosynthesis protein [Enterobacter cloacae]|nr:polysaccharide biosynthesis protein [Enterobacter cloacae]